MKKSNKTKQQQQVNNRTEAPGISKTGWRVIASGVLFLVVGYIVLSRTDPAGQNWASKLSPFLILGGYALIGAGIIVPGKDAGNSLPQQSRQNNK